MIVRDSKHSEKSKAIVAEDLDDLFTLRRIIEINDTIITDTTRSIKQKSEFSRPDKGERVKIRILLRIETIKFDGTVDRIRIGGTILNSDNQLVPKGVHHSISIKVDDMIILEKKQTNISNKFDIISNKSHSQAYHTSRLLDFTTKLNEVLDKKDMEIYNYNNKHNNELF